MEAALARRFLEARAEASSSGSRQAAAAEEPDVAEELVDVLVEPLSLLPVEPLSPLLIEPLSPLLVEALPLSLEFDDDASEGAAALFEEELYRSAYQPRPFRINPVPREICRRAVC
jgi:hypothetical protein